MKPYKNEFVVCGVYVTLKQIIQMWSIFQKVPYHTTLQYFKMVEKKFNFGVLVKKWPF